MESTSGCRVLSLVVICRTWVELYLVKVAFLHFTLAHGNVGPQKTPLLMASPLCFLCSLKAQEDLDIVDNIAAGALPHTSVADQLKSNAFTDVI